MMDLWETPKTVERCVIGCHEDDLKMLILKGLFSLLKMA